jgi:FkbM family methyltransferase
MFATLTQYIRRNLVPDCFKRIYRAVRHPPLPTNPEKELSMSIYRELAAAKGTINGDIVSLNGVSIRVEPPRVIETIHEVLLSDDYRFFEDSSTYVMIDVGMNVGITAISKASDPRFMKIYAFEPLKPTYTLALANIELNPLLKSKINTFNFGLSDQDQELVIKFTPDHIMSISSESTFDICFERNLSEERIQLKKASAVLEAIMRRHKADSPAKIFLKVDCEGAEFKIMNDLQAKGLLEHVDIAIIEWHRKDPAPILNLLSSNGFFYFLERKNVEWNVGLIKAVRTSPSRK